VTFNPIFRVCLTHLKHTHCQLWSDSFEVAFSFPVGDGGVEGGLFGSEEVGVMIHDVGPEGLAGEFTVGKEVGSLA
jgi:hypothetical protein